MRVLTDVTGETLRRWREAKGWDVPRMARELRKAARDSGEDVAAHHGLVKIFADTLSDLSQGMLLGTNAVLRLAEVRSRAAHLPGPDEIKALEEAALAEPRKTMSPAEIRSLAAEAIAYLHEVADKLTELSALLGDHEAGDDKP